MLSFNEATESLEKRVPAAASDRVAERLRRNIAEDPITCSSPEGALKITTSIGGALIDFEPHTVAEALERADKMLYQAKEEGRDCCVIEFDGKLDPATIPVRERPLEGE